MNNNIGQADLKLLKELYPNNFEEQLTKIKNHYPIQYLIGYVDFYNSLLKVDQNVLIPRFETELLVEKTIKYLKNTQIKTIIDIGTGSGAIAINLKKNLNLDVTACDISSKALKLAQKNAKINNVNINFYKIDILTEIPSAKYDCIISNPPYLKENASVSPETKYEPQIALYAKNNGLEFYERIIDIAPIILNKNGIIIFEIEKDQGSDLKKMAQKKFPNAKINIEKDFNNYDRYIFIKT